MRRSFSTVVVAGFTVLAGLASVSAQAADAEAGKAKAAVCAACHGQDGIATIPMYPNLAGQNAAYIISALTAYKNKTRTGGQAVVMHGQAAGLSEADMANLAAYYASLKPGGK
ncbi:cytochrome c [Allohahella marinimesophila]|uniref:Cytochrome c domain-containing protein n=1 Tax=Allohahella marinimesophila TaxID=1054972 RepID=A0ABP7P2E0_9GAMM